MVKPKKKAPAPAKKMARMQRKSKAKYDSMGGSSLSDKLMKAPY